MKNLLSKVMAALCIVVMTLTICPSLVNAADKIEEAIIFEKNDNKIVYIKNLESTEFKYAFSNTEENAGAIYQNCQTDTKGEKVAVIPNDETSKYMLVTTNGTDIKVIDLSAIEKITEVEVKNVETLTKKIQVNTKETKTTKTVEDGKEVTTTVGKIVIEDEDKENYNYTYQLIEILDKNDTVSTPNETAVDLYSQLMNLSEATKMYEKLETEIKIRDEYSKLTSTGSWSDAKNYEILQPEEAVNDEKYIVLIKKLDNENLVENDIQFMTCFREDDEGVEISSKPETVPGEKEVPSLLPTGENIVIYIALGLVLIAIVVIAGRMFFIKKKGKHEK